MGRRLVCIAIALAVALGASACGHRSTPSSGIIGLAASHLPSTNPSPSPLPDGFGDSVWYEPDARAAVTVRNGSGDVIARLVAGKDGTFRIALPPGSYYLQGEKLPKFFWTPMTLKPGVWARVDVTTDP